MRPLAVRGRPSCVVEHLRVERAVPEWGGELRCALEDHQFRGLLRDQRDCLDPTGAGADDRDAPAGEVDGFVRPVTGQQHLSAEVVDASELGLLGDREVAGAGDEPPGRHGLAGVGTDRPPRIVVVPMHTDHPRAERDRLPQVEAVGHMVQVAEDLRLPGELLAPLPFLLQVLVERVRVVDRLDVAAGAGIAVPVPGATHIVAGLEDPHGHVHPVAQSVQRVQAGETGSYDDDVGVGGDGGSGHLSWLLGIGDVAPAGEPKVCIDDDVDHTHGLGVNYPIRYLCWPSHDHPGMLGPLSLRSVTMDLLPESAPPRTAGPTRSVTTFVGRRREIDEARSCLQRTRLLTILGPGGVGKTRVAEELAVRTSRAFRDSFRWIDLAVVRDPESVPSAAAAALGVTDQSTRPVMDKIIDRLRDQHMLIVVDNCEHLIATVADFVAAVLGDAPEVRILATSREPLAVAGETEYVLPPLTTPEGSTGNRAADLERFEAVGLLAERARQVVPDFEVTDDNADAVAQLCIALDGVPLALELAATRLRSLSPAQLVDRLDRRFALLTGGSRVAVPRQQTLRA